MRIGMVCPYSLTIPGGVQMQVLGLARSLRTLGHSVQILAPCDGPPPETAITPLGKSIPFATNGSVAPIAPDPTAALRTIRALRNEKFDVLHLHEPFVPGPTLTALYVADIPIVGTFHRAGASRAYSMLAPISRRLAKRIDRPVAVSEDARATAIDGVGADCPFTVLFNGIDVERFARAAATPASGKTIVFVGRHEQRKGLAVLLEARHALADDVTIWVAGQGPETERLQAETAGDARIHWLGRISDDELASRLAGADVFCAPSLHGESFGVVLLEAMAAGTAIVASELPGYRAVAKPGEHAVMVPIGDAEALGKALNELLQDDARRDELVAAGRTRAQEFAMSTLAAAYGEIYDSLRPA